MFRRKIKTFSDGKFEDLEKWQKENKVNIIKYSFSRSRNVLVVHYEDLNEIVIKKEHKGG